ncbi:unnamed protein product [Protopolystoma xenopodis]|uniref:Major facilitator superfamily (MFS) profile domain-containing protein n=1 Tax=Protopolystoma xenopodis TaxID=117903 RepID=A0A3S5B399_9PLAT|nr:unnamed protein product [Protopolystoma xenopodis]
MASSLSEKWGYREVALLGSILASVGIAATFFCDSLIFFLLSSSVVAG